MFTENLLKTKLASFKIKLNKFRVGNGGSSVVHKAEILSGSNFESLGVKDIAIKEFRDGILDLPSQVERINQEADFGRRLEHENLVKTFGLLESIDEKSNSALLIMEWVAGISLEKWFEKNFKEINWEKVKSVLIPLAKSMNYLHENNVFHRDIKPENVMIKKGNIPILMDVGIAELNLDDEHTFHTTIENFVGSTRYSSPQFLRGDKFTTSDDIYSFGTILHYLITGKMVFDEIERKSLIPYYAMTTKPSIPSLIEGMPKELSVLLKGCLNHAQDRRPNDNELINSIENPINSNYISKEIKRQLDDARGYEVVSVDFDEHHFFADLRGDKLSKKVYAVVRRVRPISISNAKVVAPEMKICDAELKHVHEGIGHFAVQSKKWIPNRNHMHSYQGDWEIQDAKILKVQLGDIVLPS